MLGFKKNCIRFI